jgi:hemerythrin
MDENDILGEHRLGVPEIDSEHALQLSVVGAFRSALAREDLEAQRVIFDRLVDYSNAHFMAEAMIMRLHAYPAAEGHLVEHRRLLDELSEVRKALGTTSWTGDGVADRLDDWFRTHLQTYDRPFALFLAEANAQTPGRLTGR